MMNKEIITVNNLDAYPGANVDTVKHNVKLNQENSSLDIELKSSDDVYVETGWRERPFGEYAYGLTIKLFNVPPGENHGDKIGRLVVTYTYEPVNHLENVTTRYTELLMLNVENEYVGNGYRSFFIDVAKTIAEDTGGLFHGGIGISVPTHGPTKEEKKETTNLNNYS